MKIIENPDNCGKNNPNWQGGRRISSHGYVEIKVLKDHPLRNANGYAYEHRIVAMKMLGRPLAKGELIHHINGNKQDNRKSNIQVFKSNAEHYYQHRKPNNNRRKPNEENIEVTCKCGCNAIFYKYDNSGRPRKYVSGHNMYPHNGEVDEQN